MWSPQQRVWLRAGAAHKDEHAEEMEEDEPSDPQRAPSTFRESNEMGAIGLPEMFWMGKLSGSGEITSGSGHRAQGGSGESSRPPVWVLDGSLDDNPASDENGAPLTYA